MKMRSFGGVLYVQDSRVSVHGESMRSTGLMPRAFSLKKVNVGFLFDVNGAVWAVGEAWGAAMWYRNCKVARLGP